MTPTKTGKVAAAEHVEKATAAAIDKVAPNANPADHGVANRDDNRKLEHTAGGTTTRAVANDVGVPMLPGDPSERVGPEDALGAGPTRGDYSKRVNAGPHVEMVPIPGGSQPITDDKGNVVDYTPNSVAVAQDARAAEPSEDIAGKKGGVDT